MEPIGSLLIAGIVPGILCTLIFMLTVYIQVRKDPALAPSGREKASLIERIESLRVIWPFGFIFILSH